MSTLIQNIAKGKRKALTESYEENKERVYYIAKSMDKSQAVKATIWAFKNAWTDIAATSNIRENDFTDFVVHKLANYLQRNSAKANKREIMNTCEKMSMDYSMNHESIEIPAEINDKLYEAIDKIATPAEKNSKTNFVAIAAISIVVIICIFAMVFIPILSEDSADDTNLIGNDELLASNTNTTANNSEPITNNSEPITSSISAKLDASLTYYADIEIKDHGTITVELDQEAAPITVANFVGLAQSGFYDGLTFHRIIEGFMMQGGDPNGNGTGGSEENISGEFTANGFDNPLSHTRGAISMARSNAPDSASSQFFIVHQDNQLSLDGKYAAFGYVTNGMDIVDEICEAAEAIDGNGLIAAGEQPIITTIKIRTEKATEGES